MPDTSKSAWKRLMWCRSANRVHVVVHLRSAGLNASLNPLCRVTSFYQITCLLSTVIFFWGHMHCPATLMAEFKKKESTFIVIYYAAERLNKALAFMICVDFSFGEILMKYSLMWETILTSLIHCNIPSGLNGIAPSWSAKVVCKVKRGQDC